MNKEEIEEIKKEFEDRVIGGMFAGGTFNDNNNQKMYSEGYKDGFEKAKEISWNFFEPIIQESNREAVEESEGKTWYFEGDDLVIKKGKWIIDRYKRHQKEYLSSIGKGEK